MRAKRTQNFGHAHYSPKSSMFAYTHKKRAAIELASQNGRIQRGISKVVATFGCSRSKIMSVSSKRGAEAVLYLSVC